MKKKYQGGGIFVDKSNIRCIQSGRILGETENWYGSLFDSLHLKIKRICIHLFCTDSNSWQIGGSSMKIHSLISRIRL